MFVIKYHAKGHRTEYFGDKKRVVNKKYAIAFGEGLREKFNQLESEYCLLENISASDMAEMMYENSCIKVNNIKW